MIDFTSAATKFDTNTIEAGEDLTFIFSCDKPGQYYKAVTISGFTTDVDQTAEEVVEGACDDQTG